MTREEIIQQVNTLLAEEFEVSESIIRPDDNLRETLALDSLNLVDLVALTQQTYHITIPVQELRQIATFNDLYDYIYERKKDE